MVRFLNGERYSEEDLQSRTTLGKLGFNQREIDFLSRRPWAELPLLYLERYVDRVRDETNPFERGLSELDPLSVTDLLKREGASAAGAAVLRRLRETLCNPSGPPRSKNCAGRTWNRKSCSG